MFEPRSEGWLSKAKKDIPRVLREFWERRIQSDDPEFKKIGKKYFKEYIKSCYADKGISWTDEVDQEFESILVERHDFNRFKRFFGDWFTISSAMVIDRVHLIQPKEKEVKEIKEDDLRDLSEFLRETKTSAVLAIGNAQTEFKTILSPNIPSSTPFQIHSITKMFTGALVLKMIEKKIIPEEELKKPLSEAFSGGFLKSLPESFRKQFQEHLSKVTLLQLMTHQAGLGDYYEFENKSIDYKNPHSYQKAMLDAIALDPEHPELPEIKQISDLLQFSEDKTYPIGEWHYSNVGITLVGLAIEYAYKQYKKNHHEDIINPDFDSLLREYILKEAKIESKNFTKTKPPDGRHNKIEKADLAAPHMTAGPAGYYWTTVEDLARFGSYFYNEYITNAEFQRLVDQYGEEFHPEEDVFSHTGTLTASSSAFLSVSKKGNIIAVACDNSDEDANALEARIKRNIYSEPFGHRKLSEYLSYSVSDVPGDPRKKKILFVYKGEKHESENRMLVIFPSDPPPPPDPQPLEYPMHYDEAKKQWSVEIERPRNAGEIFAITDAKIPGHPDNPKAAVLQRGFISPVDKNPKVPEGKLEKFLYNKDGEIKEPVDEKELKEGERLITIYFPPGYNKEKHPPYNVQINLDGSQYLEVMTMDTILDNLIYEKKIEPVVAVFIAPYTGAPDAKITEDGFPVKPRGYSLRMRYEEYTCNPEFAEKIARLPAEMRKQFNITDDPAHTTICGLSLGGLQAAYTALLYPKVIGNVICQSAAAQWGPPEDKTVITEDWATCAAPFDRPDLHEYLRRTVESGHDERSAKDLEPSSLQFYLAVGDKETGDPERKMSDLVAATDHLSVALRNKGHSVVKIIFSGNHSHVDWIKLIPNAEMIMHLNGLMHDAYIPGMSIASIDGERISATTLGLADAESKRAVMPDTVFWACSLSKPVFAYLIIKLIADGELSKDFLDAPLPWDEKQLGPQGDKKPLTARMILSHQTGLPNEGPAEFKFNPGEGFRYSGVGYVYLQKVIEKMTGKELEALAQTKLFVPLRMRHSSFLFPEEELKPAKTHDEAMVPNPLPKLPANDSNAAASLHTTAGDYTRFLMACLQDEVFLEIMKSQVVSMEKDIDAREKGIDQATLKSIDWGLGFGLQKDEKGNPIAAFHWGHGPGARSFFEVRFGPHPSAIVYLTNSENGMAIAEVIAAPIIGDIAPVMAFLAKKYGYAKISSPHWEEYHECLLAGVEAEKKDEFTRAISCYREAVQFSPERKEEIEYRIEWADAMRIQKLASFIPNEKLKELEGEYGALKIVVSESKIQIDDGRDKRDLIAIDENTFLDGKVILKFNRDGNGILSSLRCHFPNGGKILFPYIHNVPVLEKEKDRPRSNSAIIAAIGILPAPTPVLEKEKKSESEQKQLSKDKSADKTEEERTDSELSQGRDASRIRSDRY